MCLAKQVTKFHLESPLHGLNINMQTDADELDAESDVDSDVDDADLEDSESDFEKDELLTVDWENVDTFKILLPSRYSPTALKDNQFEQLIHQEK